MFLCLPCYADQVGRLSRVPFRGASDGSSQLLWQGSEQELPFTELPFRCYAFCYAFVVFGENLPRFDGFAAGLFLEACKPAGVISNLESLVLTVARAGIMA